MKSPQHFIGKRIDRYLVERYLASGGMADVYVAEDIDLDRKVAIKVMRADLVHREDFVARFQREARAVAKLNHPNIVQIYTNGLTPSGQPFFAMQYVSDGSLQTYLNRLAQKDERFPVEIALKLFHQIADALQAAHNAGIIHRDLKPGNILMHEDGRPLVSDLGIAAISTATTRLTQTGAVMGTPHYMSPEQARGEPVDSRSDIYALGVIMYELLAGKVPFTGDSPLSVLHKQIYEPVAPLRTVRSGLSKVIYDIVETCLQKDPDDRFQTVGQLLLKLDQAINHSEYVGNLEEEPPPSKLALQLQANRLSSHRLPYALMLTVAIVLMTVGVALLASSGRLATLFGGGEATATPSMEERIPSLAPAVDATETAQPEPSPTPMPTEMPTVEPLLMPSPVPEITPEAPEIATPQANLACINGFVFVWMDAQVNANRCGQFAGVGFELEAGQEVEIIDSNARTVFGPAPLSADGSCQQSSYIKVRSMTRPEIEGWVFPYAVSELEPGESCSP